MLSFSYTSMDTSKYFKFLFKIFMFVCFRKYLEMEIKVKKKKKFHVWSVYKWGTVILNLSIFSFLDIRMNERKKKRILKIEQTFGYQNEYRVAYLLEDRLFHRFIGVVLVVDGDRGFRLHRAFSTPREFLSFCPRYASETRKNKMLSHSWITSWKKTCYDRYLYALLIRVHFYYV